MRTVPDRCPDVRFPVNKGVCGQKDNGQCPDTYLLGRVFKLKLSASGSLR